MEFPVRKLNRLKNWDYSNGWFFVTADAGYHGDIFGRVINGNMVNNDFGKIVLNQWEWMVDHFNIWGDEFIVMPDHVHGLLYFPKVGTGLDLSDHKKNDLSKVISAFKTLSCRDIRRNGLNEFIWQRSFFDEVIKDEKQYWNIKKYIQDNPKNWKNDL